MSFLDADSFTYDGENSDTYDLLICWVDDKPDVSNNGLRRSVENSHVNHVRFKTSNYEVNHDGNIEFSFYVIKKDQTSFTRHESMSINQWLTKSVTPKKLVFNDYIVPSIHYYAVCTEIEDISYHGHEAKKITFKTNSPYGFMHTLERRFIVSGTETFEIYNPSDMANGYYYPKVLISTSSDNDIVIENMSDQKSVTFNFHHLTTNSEGKKNILIENASMKVLDGNNANRLIPCYQLGWDLDYSSYVSATDTNMDQLYWLRLVNGINQIKITGECDVTFIFEFPRKVGCL